MMTGFFVVLGFALTFSYYGESVLTAFFTVIYIVSATMILEPLILKFWINLFNQGFNSNLNTTIASVVVLFTSNDGLSVSINFWNMKVAMLCSIAQLLMYFAILGRIQIYKVMVANIFFIFAWTLNYAIVTHMYTKSFDSRINDDFSIDFTYLYGGFAGLVAILDTPSRLVGKIRSRRFHPQYPKILAMLGNIFLCLGFVFTHAIVGKKDNVAAFTLSTDQRAVFMPEGAIGVFFAISSSVVSIGAWGVIFNQFDRMQLVDFLGSSIAGALMFGPVANFANNLAIPIVLGMAAGFVCTLYKSKIMPKINRKNIKDSLGLLGPFFICPILGNFIAAPVIIYCY